MGWNLALGALAASWGFIAVLAASVELGADALAFWRLALAAATLCFVAVVSRRSGLLRPRGRLGALALLGVVQGVHWLLFFEAVEHGSVHAAQRLNKGVDGLVLGGGVALGKADVGDFRMAIGTPGDHQGAGPGPAKKQGVLQGEAGQGVPPVEGQAGHGRSILRRGGGVGEGAGGGGGAGAGAGGV